MTNTRTKNTKLKIILALAIAAFCTFAGLFYYVSKKISPEEIRKTTLALLESNFPHAQIELGQIDYSLGLSVTLNVKTLKMALKDRPLEEGRLLSLNEFDVKIPIWAIITDSGTISINVDRPEIYYAVFPDNKNNWSLAMPEKKDEVKEEASADTTEQPGLEDKKVKVLNFFSKTKINIKLTNVNLVYKMADGVQGSVLLSQFLIKDLNLKTSTAFELASKLKLQLKDGKNAEFEALVIGHINIHELIQNKDLQTSMIITLDHLQLPQLKQAFPTIKTELEVNVKRESGDVKALVNSDFGPVGVLKTVVGVQQGILSVNDLKAQFSIKEVMNLAAPDMEMVDASGAKLNIQGSLQKGPDFITPKIEFDFGPAITIKVDKELTLKSSGKGGLIGKDFKLSVNNQAYNGHVDLNAQAEIDLSQPKFDLQKMPPIKLDIQATNLNFSEEFLHKKMYSSAAPASASQKEGTSAPKGNSEAKVPSQESTDQVPLQELKGRPAPNFPSVIANAKWNHIKVGGEEFSGNAKVVIAKNQVASENFQFHFSQGKGSLTFLLQLLAEGATKLDMDFQLAQLNLDSLRPFLPPNIDQVTGIFTGSVKGNLHKIPLENQLEYLFNVNLEAKNGEVRGINLANAVQLVLEKVPLLQMVVKKKDYKISNDFEKLNLQGLFSHKKYHLLAIAFVGLRQSVEVTGSGEIYPVAAGAKESFLELNYIDHTGKLSQHLEEKVGSKILPLRLEGPNFNLTPDYGYTIEQLGKMALKKNKAKIEEKVKKEVEKKVKKEVEKGLDKLKDKLLKQEGGGDEGKKIKKLFKGLFE